jgi:hypothetical protein
MVNNVHVLLVDLTSTNVGVSIILLGVNVIGKQDAKLVGCYRYKVVCNYLGEEYAALIGAYRL